MGLSRGSGGKSRSSRNSGRKNEKSGRGAGGLEGPQKTPIQIHWSKGYGKEELGDSAAWVVFSSSLADGVISNQDDRTMGRKRKMGKGEVAPKSSSVQIYGPEDLRARSQSLVEEGVLTGKHLEVVTFRGFSNGPQGQESWAEEGYRHLIFCGLGESPSLGKEIWESSEEGLELNSEKSLGSDQGRAGMSLPFSERFRQLGASLLEVLKGLKSKDIFLNLLDLEEALFPQGEGMGSVSGESTKKATRGRAVSSGKVVGSPLSSPLSQLIPLYQALLEGFILSSYQFRELKSQKGSSESIRDGGICVHIVTRYAESLQMDQALKESVILGEAVNFSRRLGDLPGNLLTPTELALEAERVVKTLLKEKKGEGAPHLSCTIWNRERIRKEKMGGLLGVSQGSEQEPRFIILEYKGSRDRKEKPVVLVGKGLTFDAGGICLKPAAGMEEMKYDKCGGINVISTFMAVVRLGIKVNLVALVPSTENLINGSATKPGDVHRARNGITFEVNNTDAEGRLILADALSYASELEPAAIFDVATLTGAIVTALGNIYTGYFSRNEALKEVIEVAAHQSGELLWRMPLCDHHVSDMKGSYADLQNVTPGNRGAGSSTAAAFLEQFVGKGIPWAHFDIAGTGWNIGNRFNYCPKKGASGVMIRTFVEMLRHYEGRRSRG